MLKVKVGDWRDEAGGPMQVVSGPIGRQKVHFEAPHANALEAGMTQFVEWFNVADGDPLVRAAAAHLWFLTLHPLDDGNGRVGRAIMDMALAQADKTSQRFYSVSAQIQLRKESYYDVLERTQRGTLEITPWLMWFLERLNDALTSAEGVLSHVIAKRSFWESHADLELNERQLKVVNLLLDGFKGKLHTEKYAKLTKCSPRTALRDLVELVEKRVLMLDPESSGRSTNYLLCHPK
jgi:Fic family protein